jgi:hypothetical protein
MVIKISDARPVALPNTGSQQQYRFVRLGAPADSAAVSAGSTVHNPVLQMSDADCLKEYTDMLDQRYPKRHGIGR